jgi:peptidoglycan/xylan/chitin deacetylase (PgdA/CDA1 family)
MFLSGTRVDRLLDLGLKVGALPRIGSLRKNSLSVLLYHRIAPATSGSNMGYRRIFNANRTEFAQQLDYIKRYYNPINLQEGLAWLHDSHELAPNSILLTFDDGYLDNLTEALPEMVKRGIPGVLFVTSGFIDGTAFPFWDWVAEAFQTTDVQEAVLPLLGLRVLRTHASRNIATDDWIERAKKTDGKALDGALCDLAVVLGRPVWTSPPEGLFMDWSGVRGMMQSGIAIGAHTVTHPVMTNVSDAVVTAEILESKKAIEAQIGTPVLSFAFPFGLSGDFHTQHEDALRAAGFRVSFCGTGGLATTDESRAHPFRVRRTCIGSSISMARFSLMASGLRRTRVLVEDRRSYAQ